MDFHLPIVHCVCLCHCNVYLLNIVNDLPRNVLFFEQINRVLRKVCAIAMCYFSINPLCIVNDLPL